MFVPARSSRAFGVLSQREAGDAEHRRLLLDPARVRHDCGGLGFEREKLPIRQRFRSRTRVEPRGFVASVGCTGKITGNVSATSSSAAMSVRAGRDRRRGSGDGVSRGRISPGSSPNSARPRVPALRPRSPGACRSSCCRRRRSCRRGPSARDSCPRRAVRQEQRRQVVGDDAVALLGHRPVVAAQAGLDVADADAVLGRGDRAGECRVDVSCHDDELRPSSPKTRSSPEGSSSVVASSWMCGLGSGSSAKKTSFMSAS